MQRRASSSESEGLLAVTIHMARLGSEIMRDSPSTRSVQGSQVTTAARALLSSDLRSGRLSSRTMGRALVSSAVTILRISSSAVGTVRLSHGRPVATMLMRLHRSPLPVPGVGASTR